MSKKKDSARTDQPTDHPSIPANIRPKYDPVWALVEKFCRERLNAEYTALCRQLLASLARKRPSPLANGTAVSWAAGVVRAIGSVNFLHDKSQTPHMKTGEIDQAFGVSQATGQAKSKTIRDLFDMVPFDPRWTLPSQMGSNPLTNMIAVNGFIMNVRSAPVSIQEEAVRRGLVPPLPGVTGQNPPGNSVGPLSRITRVYTLEIYILSGSLTRKFVKKNKVISRKIQIRGDQTLADLHQAIFDAFDRFDEHLYEFQLGKQMHDGPRYRPAMPDGFEEDGDVGIAEETTIESLNLTTDRAFGYWFDFGDDWMHQIDVISIDETVPKGNYPKLISSVGASPPQYPDEEDID